MRCRLCKKPAVYGELRFCEDHFLAYYEKKVRHYLDRAGSRNIKVLIAVSGGKDSAAAADILSRVAPDYGLSVSLFSINLRIPGYSNGELDAVRALSEKIGVDLIVWDLADYPKVVSDFVGGRNSKPCSQCGVIKRYLLNKAAVDMGFDYVVTGHNLDDEFYFVMHSLLHRDLGQLMRSDKVLPPKPEKRMAGRLKPLYYITEKENMIYSIIRSLPIHNKVCPYSKGSSQLNFKEKFPFSRSDKLSLLKSVERLKRDSAAVDKSVAQQEIILEKKHKPSGSSYQNISMPLSISKDDGEKSAVRLCRVCGFPTTRSDSCVFCRLMSPN